ncbi:MAG TPA: hypothetical protein VM577_08300 [Anaerovoracaceae bacterium]|nr:hypothetical protein [Anaerovoracaceae bacterium]
MNFEQRCQLLTDLGSSFGKEYEYRTNKETGERGPHDVDLFTSILLPLTPAEWCDMCMREGQNYLGGCCGNMSAMQDIINGIFRDSGYVSCRDLEEFAEHAAHHDSFTDVPFDQLPLSLEEFAPVMKREWANYSPWDKIACIWHIVRDHYGPAMPHGYGDHMSELEKSITVLSRGLTYLSFARVFNRSEEKKEPTTQAKADRAAFMNRLLPCLKVLNDHVHELNPGPVEGFALIDKQTGPDAIASNGYGLCVYSTMAEVKKILKQWKKNDEEFKEEGRNYSGRQKTIDEKIGVRKVRISVENGIEFLEEECKV